MHIAGNPSHLTVQQRELIDLAAALGRQRFAPRAAAHEPAPAAVRTGRGEREAAGIPGGHARALTVGAYPRHGAGLGAGTGAVGTGVLPGQAHLRGQAA